MSLSTLPATPSPDVGITRTVSYNTLEAQFGDGYSQRAKIGINNKPMKMSLKWSNINETEKDTLETFFDAHDGGEAFLYTPPDQDASSKWIVDGEYSVVYVAYQVYNVSVSIKEVFDV